MLRASGRLNPRNSSSVNKFKLFGLLVCFVVLLAVGFGIFLPKDYRVQRSIVIDAPQESVYKLLADFREWPRWSPWENEDDRMEFKTGVLTRGVGARQYWVGAVGGGDMEITHVTPDRIEYRVRLDESALYSDCSMALHRQNNRLLLTWELSGVFEIPVVGGYVAMLMEWFSGQTLSGGLDNIKRLAED